MDERARQFAEAGVKAHRNQTGLESREASEDPHPRHGRPSGRSGNAGPKATVKASVSNSLVDGGIRCVIFAARNHGASAMRRPPWSGQQTDLD